MIEIVNSHNKVLSAWAKYRCSLEQAPRLITLDHHTDTSKAFRNLINKEHENVSEADFMDIQNKHLDQMNFKDPESIQITIDKLSNDEHIVAAIKSNIISSALVLAQNAVTTDIETYKEHKIICHMVDHAIRDDEKLHPQSDLVIDSKQLDDALFGFNKILKENNEEDIQNSPYVLDIDLDYFNTFKSIEPPCLKSFQRLIKNAGLITIATEPEYVKTCSLDAGLTSEYLLVKLTSIIEDSV